VKVAVVAHFFPPEPGAGALRVRSLVEALAAAGNEVTVVTSFPSFPKGAFLEPRRPAIRVERNGRVKIVRLFSLLVWGMPGARLVHWVSAALSASFYLTVTREHYDVIVISSPPITLALPGLVAAARHRARLVVDVRDVYPDIGIAMGVWKPNTFIVRVLDFVVRRLYRRANLIVAVTPTGVKQIARHGVDASRIVLARNASERTPKLQDVPRRGNGFTAIYAGDLGLSTDVDVLADAATLVAHDGITIEIIGDGAQRGRLGERVQREGIDNLRLKGSFSRPEALAMVASADISIIPLRKGLTESVPTKLYDSLSVGCPVVVAAEGEAIEEGSSLGAFCTPAGDAGALAGVLRQVSLLDKNALRELGDKGKARVQERADREGIMAGLVDRIAGL
jgi:colanic acid biosynthesis glycosyl transferase WcaI